MRRAIMGIVILVLLPALAHAEAPSAEQFRKHVPIIRADGQGSGYYVGGRVQTARHVVGENKYVVMGVERYDQGVVECADEVTDSAVVSGPVGPLLEVGEKPWPGQHVTIAGWKRGQYVEFRTAISGYQQMAVVLDHADRPHLIGPVVVLWSMGPSMSGMSGGPIVDLRGRVVATFVAYGPATAYGVPLDGAACKAKVGG